MNRVIINADDCGISKQVDAEIERFIQLGKITSTTVMANMDDLEGAKRLYDLYKDKISFGVHVNLTDGEPLTQSQALLDFGYFKEENGKVLLNGYPFINKKMPKRLYQDIANECVAQINKVRDMGIAVSHIDSHHLMLTSSSMTNITPKVLRQACLTKMRRARNYIENKSFSFFVRQAWFAYMKMRVKGLRSTDWFEMFTCFYNLSNKGFLMDGTIELMTHPGGNYPKEDELILKTDYSQLFKDYKLINYNNL
jgi:predicted glycoside hydrolase/deacetylase ChbG (UPF0249 family)